MLAAEQYAPVGGRWMARGRWCRCHPPHRVSVRADCSVLSDYFLITRVAVSCCCRKGQWPRAAALQQLGTFAAAEGAGSKRRLFNHAPSTLSAAAEADRRPVLRLLLKVAHKLELELRGT